MQAHPPPVQTGFTLVELVVVMAIAAILLTLAVPSFNDSIARRRVEGASNELSADLQYAKTQALNNNAGVSLTTSPTGYVISGTTAAGNQTYKTITLNSGLSITQPITLTYSAFRGFPATATAFTISNMQATVQLRVSTDTTGRVLTCSPTGTMNGYPTC